MGDISEIRLRRLELTLDTQEDITKWDQESIGSVMVKLHQDSMLKPKCSSCHTWWTKSGSWDYWNTFIKIHNQIIYHLYSYDIWHNIMYHIPTGTGYVYCQPFVKQPNHSLEALTLPESTCNQIAQIRKTWRFHNIILLSRRSETMLGACPRCIKKTVEFKFPENNSAADCTGQPHHSHLQATISCKDIEPDCMIFGNIHKDYDMNLRSSQ